MTARAGSAEVLERTLVRQVATRRPPHAVPPPRRREVPAPPEPRTIVELVEPTVVWTRSAAPAPARARGPAPAPSHRPAHALAGPAPALAPSAAPSALAAGPAPAPAQGSAPARARGPAPAPSHRPAHALAGPAPVLAPSAAPSALAAGPAPALAQGSAPAQLGVTPLVEREVFQLARRVALQADLPAAVRVLHHGLARLTDSPDATCVFFDPALCSAWALPDGDTPRALDGEVQRLVAQVAGSGRRAVLGRVLLEPVGPSPARAVLMIRRPTGAAYGELEIATIGAVAAAIAGILGHFAAAHAARREQELRDARSPFRPEALAERRGATAAPGRLVKAPRTWVRWAYPTLIGLVAAVVIAAAMIQVPTYSTGVSIITASGEQVTSPMPGTVAEVLVAPGARVAAGDLVLRLRALDEEAELAATDADHRNALATFLTSPGDDGARTALAAIATRRQRAKAAVDARTLRAPSAGVVGDIRVRPGQLVAPGAPIMKISPSADLSVIALLPGADRPRLEAGMTLQIDLPGYHKKREEAVIDAIGSQVIGPEEARKSLGDPIGDALPIAGPVVLVRAHLTARTFEAGGRAYAFHDGMLGKAEVEVDHDSLLRMLLPGKAE